MCAGLAVGATEGLLTVGGFRSGRRRERSRFVRVRVRAAVSLIGISLRGGSVAGVGALKSDHGDPHFADYWVCSV